MKSRGVMMSCYGQTENKIANNPIENTLQLENKSWKEISCNVMEYKLCIKGAFWIWN